MHFSFVYIYCPWFIFNHTKINFQASIVNILIIVISINLIWLLSYQALRWTEIDCCKIWLVFRALMKLHPGHKINRALCLVQIHYAIHDMLTQTCKQTYFVMKTNLVIIWSITSKIFMNYTPWLISVDHFTKGLWAHNWNLVKINLL